ncbi:coiled-coil domain-containing protein 124-like [Dendronephthya gigantea]|uniref:coiled-coil domain-containing protein 124-like n=1 Tax=Dendronephthya gigantea TaxID=151771 RepID=UPI00106AB5D3|nr:coiled-coil domain-containing protein 124-like [Dendronephthya gigantea]
MPKKFQGTNTKAEAARARKSEAKNAEKVRKDKETEDKYWESWESGDRNESRKKERKEDKEKKRLEQLEKKRLAKELLEAEESKLKGKTATQAKVTRSEIATLQEREAEKRKTAAANKNVTVDDSPLEENVNQLIAENLATEGGVEARNVEEAISVLAVDDKQESHPERRMKAAFAKFEEERLPVLKAENPNMRLSQIKQLLRKEWLKSPDNPLNQNFVAYNKK